MDILTDNIKEEIKAHALDVSPDECCGLIIDIDGKTRALKCKNAAQNTRKNFRINELDYLSASEQGKIKGYYHSHVHDEAGEFSAADAQVSKAQGIPLIMYSIYHDDFYGLSYE